ncbi:MAG TPA: tRNA pseudouridine(55) synthase TruB [Gemmatimonadaceae bacterium]|nr:tRNA pseudouridine(55) synthase TruB [Gemmatimonadaceae bacterium]
METSTTDAGGLLLVDKPAGLTSHDVVAIVRRAVRARRVGHTGTLDPFATGLLVVLIGRATRLIPYVDGEPKVYDAAVRFGKETDTDDATGEVTREAPLPDRACVADAIACLTGTIEQMPPAYSAKKVAGVRAYAAARRGDAVELAPATITVHGWDDVRWDADSLHARITCSGGTYIRALARDLGRLAASAAHLSALRRIRAGAFSVDEAATVDRLKSGDFAVRPPRCAIPSMPARTLSGVELGRVVHGNPIAADGDEARVALVDSDGTLVAIAEREEGELRPRLVLRDV